MVLEAMKGRRAIANVGTMLASLRAAFISPTPALPLYKFFLNLDYNQKRGATDLLATILLVKLRIYGRKHVSKQFLQIKAGKP